MRTSCKTLLVCSVVECAMIRLTSAPSVYATPNRRCRALTRFFVPVLHGLYQRGLILGAFRDGSLVGVCGVARPGLCQPTSLEKLSVIPSVVFGNPLGTPMRLLKWAGEWARRDLAEPHWHLGPVAVDSHFQGHGIGGAMMADSCARMDGCGELSYLETDRFENVRFYERFGFTVTAESEILGLPNWFMSRPSRNGGKDPKPVEGHGK